MDTKELDLMVSRFLYARDLAMRRRNDLVIWVRDNQIGIDDLVESLKVGLPEEAARLEASIIWGLGQAKLENRII